MKAIYTLIALVVFAAAFSDDTFAQKGFRLTSNGSSVHTVGLNRPITVGAAQSISVGAAQSQTVRAVRSRQIVDGTSNTIMFSNRVATGDVNGDSLLATTYGRGNARRSGIAGDFDGDSDVDGRDFLRSKAGSQSLTAGTFGRGTNVVTKDGSNNVTLENFAVKRRRN